MDCTVFGGEDQLKLIRYGIRPFSRELQLDDTMRYEHFTLVQDDKFVIIIGFIFYFHLRVVPTFRLCGLVLRFIAEGSPSITNRWYIR